MPPSQDISQDVPESEREVTQWARENRALFQHDIDTLKLQAKSALKAVDKLSKEQENIGRKSDKERSKELHGCIKKYQDSISILQTASERISEIVNNRKIKVPLVEKRSTFDGRGHKKKNVRQTECEQTECDRCYRKDGEIMRLQSRLEKKNEAERPIAKYGAGIERKEAEIERKEVEFQESQRRIQDENESLRSRLQMEIEAKEDALRRYEAEIKRKEVEYQESQRRIQDEKDRLHKRLQKETEAKEDDLRRTKETERTIATYEAEIKRKEAEYQESQRRIQDENDRLCNRLQMEIEAKEVALRRTNETEKTIMQYKADIKRKEYQERTNETERTIAKYEADIKRKEAEYRESQRRIQDESNRLRKLLQMETEAKEDVLRMFYNYMTKEAERTIAKYEAEIKRKEAEYQESQRRIQGEIDSLCNRLQMEIEAKEDALRRIIEIERTITQYKADIKGKETEYQERTNETERTIAKYVADIKNKEAEYRESQRRIQDDNERLRSRLQIETEEPKRKVAMYKAEIKRKEAEYQESQRRIQDENERLRSRLQMEIEAKEDALRRLSSMASSKLRDNNPNITDLSDQNRPTKIAERLSELYDNQWTDAFDALESSMQEEQIIQTLLDTLMKVYEECYRLSHENFYERIQNCIESPLEPKSRTTGPIALPEQLKQQVKEFRKTRAAHVIKDIETVITTRIQIPNSHSRAIQTYLAQCVWIGWFCAVQDPPLLLSVSSSSKFDTNLFKDYTKRGRYVEFIVWPALYLHEKGALLSKGVAQGCDSPPENKPVLATDISDSTKQSHRYQGQMKQEPVEYSRNYDMNARHGSTMHVDNTRRYMQDQSSESAHASGGGRREGNQVVQTMYSQSAPTHAGHSRTVYSNRSPRAVNESKSTPL